MLSNQRTDNIVLPEKVVLRLVNSDGNPLRMRNVLFTVRAFAKHKNDFNLGPFATDEGGIVTITKSDLLAEAAAHYDSGLMDYQGVEYCKPDVTIAPMTADETEKALEARTSVWTMLLKGEGERWTSIDELRRVYREAANRFITAEPMNVRWDGKTPEYEYRLVAKIK